MKRALKLLAVLLWVALGCEAVAVPWPGVEYAEVRVFAWPKDHAGLVLLPGGKPARGAISPAGKLLTTAQTQQVLKAQSRRYLARPLAGCYNPHHAFVFYDRAHKPVAFLEICLDCLGARSWPEDPESDPDYLQLGALCAELKLPLGRYASLAELRREVAPLLQPIKEPATP